jgi:hypothetical protein
MKEHENHAVEGSVSNDLLGCRPSKGRRAMILEFGNGDIEIVTLRQEDKIGLLLRRQSEPHPIGEFSNTGGEIYHAEENEQDVTIWLNKLESARILQDTVNLAVLNLQGLPREK